MSGQGYHFAVTEATARGLLDCKDEMDIIDSMDELCDSWGTDETSAGGYKEWDILHRCLSEARSFDPAGGTYPLNRCFLGGRLLVREGSIVNLVVPNEVHDIASALELLGQDTFHARFMELYAAEYAQGGDADKDAERFWQMICDLRSFYRWAAEGNRAVVFYTDDPLDYFFP